MDIKYPMQQKGFSQYDMVDGDIKQDYQQLIDEVMYQISSDLSFQFDQYYLLDIQKDKLLQKDKQNMASRDLLLYCSKNYSMQNEGICLILQINSIFDIVDSVQLDVFIQHKFKIRTSTYQQVQYQNNSLWIFFNLFLMQKGSINIKNEIILKKQEQLRYCLFCDVQKTECYIKDTFQINLQYYSCQMCPLGCKSCVYSNQHKTNMCRSCLQSYQLQKGRCQKMQNCQNGSYFNELSECVKCQDNCLLCNTKDSCQLCENGYVLDSYRCKSKCEQGFQWSQNNQCEEICGDGLRYKKSGCDDGNNLSGDGCNSNCEIEENYECMRESVLTPDICQKKTNIFDKQRSLYVNQDSMFRLVSNQENQITVEVLKKVAMYGKMNEILTVYIPDCEYSLHIIYEEFTYITYTFNFHQLVPSKQTAYFNVTLPNKIFPSPDNLLGLALVIQTRNTYQVPDQQIQNILTRIISYFVYISQIVFLISTLLLKTQSFQSLVFWSYSIFQITGFYSFPASLNLKSFIDKIHSSQLQFDISNPEDSFQNLRSLEGKQRQLSDTGDQFNPINFSLQNGHLDLFMVFYIILGAILCFHILLGIVALLNKNQNFKCGLKKRFVLNYYLAVCFLFYETYSEDIIYRIYNQKFIDQKEQIICYISAAFILLHPYYLLPILIKQEKEQDSSALGEQPLSFYYLNYDFHTKWHFYIQIPLKMIFVSVGNLVKLVLPLGYPFYLIGQCLLIALYNFFYKSSYTDNKIWMIDLSIAVIALVQSTFLVAVSQQSYIFYESDRSQVANVIIYLPFLEIFIFLVYYARLILEVSSQYFSEREQRKRVIPIDVFIQQTRTYQMSKKNVNLDSEEKLPKSEFNSMKSRPSLATNPLEFLDGQPSFNNNQTKTRGSVGQLPTKKPQNSNRFSLQNTLFVPGRKNKKETSILPIQENKAYENDSSDQEDSSEQQSQKNYRTNQNIQKQNNLFSQNPNKVNSLQQFINFNAFEGKKNITSNSPINSTEQNLNTNHNIHQRKSVKPRISQANILNSLNQDVSPNSSNPNFKTTPYISVKTKPTEFSDQVDNLIL